MLHECNFTDECVNILCFDDCNNLTVKDDYQSEVPFHFDGLSYCESPDVVEVSPGNNAIGLLSSTVVNGVLQGETFIARLNNTPFDNCKLTLKFDTKECIWGLGSPPPVPSGPRIVEVWGSSVLPCRWDDRSVPYACDGVNIYCANGDNYRPVCLGSAVVTATNTTHTIPILTASLPIELNYLIFVFKENPTCVELDNFSLIPDCAVETGFTYNDDICNEIIFTPNASGTRLSHSWNFGDGGTSTLDNPTHSFASNGTYNVTHTVLDNCGNSHAETMGVWVNCCTPSEGFIVIDGSEGAVSMADLITLGVFPAMTSIYGAHIYLNGTLHLDVNNQDFINCKWICTPGSEIIIDAATSILIRANNFSSCEKMWKGITNNGRLTIGQSHIFDAQYGITLNDLSSLSCSGNTFDKCYTGIYSPPVSSTLKNITNTIVQNGFYCNGILKPAYPGQLDYPSGFSNPLIPARITYAGIDLNYVNLSNTGLFSPGGNVFDGIRNGIIINRGSNISSGNIIRNLKGRELNTYVPKNYSGIGILNSYTLSNIHTYNNVKNIEFGIYIHQSNYGNIIISKNNIVNGTNLPGANEGVTVIYSKGSRINVEYDTIESRLPLHIKNVSPIGLLVENNSISTQLFNPLGGQTGLIFDSYNHDSNPFGQVRNNTITLKGKLLGGASFLSSSGLVFENNSLLKNGLTSNPMQSVSNSSYINIYNNLYFNNSTPHINTMGLISDLSTGTAYCCNEIVNTYNGISFTGYNDGTNLRANTFVGGGITLDNAYIGHQTHKGNIWSGTQTVGRIIGNTQQERDDIAYNSRFFVNTVANPDFQPDIIIGIYNPSDWFVPDNGVAETCGEKENCVGVLPLTEDNLGLRSCDDENLSDYIQIAKGITLEGYYADQNRWSAQSQLYQLLAENKIDHWQDCSILSTFFNNADTYAQYYTIEKNINELKKADNVQAEQIDNANTIIKEAIADLVDLYTNYPDTARTYPYQDQVNAINEVIMSNSTVIYNIEAEINIRAMNSAEVNLEWINSLPEPYFFNIEWKNVFKIKNKYALNGFESLNEEDIEQLQQIALLCPLMYGKCVYEAQSMLNRNGDMVFPDISEACQVIEGRKTKPIKQEREIACYPNPSTGTFTLAFPESEERKERTYDIEIRNNLGALCYKSTFTSPEGNVEIDISNNGSGIYYLIVKESAEKVMHKKLVIIK